MPFRPYSLFRQCWIPGTFLLVSWVALSPALAHKSMVLQQAKHEVNGKKAVFGATAGLGLAKEMNALNKAGLKIEGHSRGLQYQLPYHLAKIADQLGYDSYTTYFHKNLSQYPFAETHHGLDLTSATGIVNKKIHVGNIVGDLLRVTPEDLAQFYKSVERQMNTDPARSREIKWKVIAGLGASEKENVFDQQNWPAEARDRVSRLEDGAKAMYSIWNATPDNPSHYQGSHTKYDGKYLQLDDTGPLEIWIAGQAPKTMAVTGRHAVAWIPISFTPKALIQGRDTVFRAMKEAGREDDIPGMGIGTVMDVRILKKDENPEEVWNKSKVPSAMGYWKDPNPALYGLTAEFDFKQMYNNEMTPQNRKDLMKKLEDDVKKNASPEFYDAIREVTLFGRPEEIADQIRRLQKQIGINIWMPRFWSDNEFSLRAFGKHVLPLFADDNHPLAVQKQDD